jgi:hypothetical protein
MRYFFATSHEDEPLCQDETYTQAHHQWNEGVLFNGSQTLLSPICDMANDII